MKNFAAKIINALFMSMALSFSASLFAAQAASGSATTATATLSDLPHQAEEAYAKGDFAAAVEHYKQIAQHAPYDANVLYNLGTAYARQGDVGRATWRYLQALQLKPRDSALRRNLAIVDPEWHSDLAMTPIPPLNLLYWWLTANEWTALAMGGTTLGFLLLALLAWIRRESAGRGALKLATGIVFAVGLLCWPPALLRHDAEQLSWTGVIVEPAQAHIDPNAAASTTFALNPGRLVRVLSQPAAGWLKISFAGDRIGFVERERVEFL